MVEGVLGPVDPARQPIDERDVRPGRLEVEEALGIDLGEAFCAPRLRQVAARERGALASVVPAAESGHEDRSRQRRPLENAELVGHWRSLRADERGKRPLEERRERDNSGPDGRRGGDVDQARATRADASGTGPRRSGSGAPTSAEHAEGEPEQSRRDGAARDEVAEHEDEAETEDRRPDRVREDSFLKSPEPVDAGSSSPACGPAAVATVPVTRSTRQPAAARSPASRSSRGTGDGTVPRSVPSATTTSTTAAPRTNGREQEVRDDEERVQVEADGAVAERGLREATRRRRPRPVQRANRGRARHAKRRQRRDQGRDDHEPTDQPVAELDEGVDVVVRERLALAGSLARTRSRGPTRSAARSRR